MLSKEKLNSINISTTIRVNDDDKEFIKILLIKEKIKRRESLTKDEKELIIQSFNILDYKDFEEIIDVFPWEYINFNELYITEKEKYCTILFKKAWEENFPQAFKDARIRCLYSVYTEYKYASNIPDDMFHNIIRNGSINEMDIVIQDIHWQEKFISLIMNDKRDVLGDEFEIPFELVSKFITLDSYFIKKYESNVNWKLITEYHFLSEKFIKTFWENLDKEILQERLRI